MDKRSLFPAVVTALFFISIPAFSEVSSDPDIETKIRKTAEAMGTSVYEDFPVSGASFGNLTKSGVGYSLSGYPLKNSFPVPEPQLTRQPASKPDLSFSETAGVYWGYAATLWNSISAQISDSGFFSSGAPSFEDISRNILKKVTNSAYAPRKYGESSLFNEEGFVAEFEKVTGSKFNDGNSVKFLVDGAESFKYKDHLIKNAQKSVYVTTWAFYDDITGVEALNLLLEKKKQGLDVRVITDGKIVSSHGISIIKKLEEAGIEVLRYREKGRAADIWHVKMIIADERYAITGGMNFGDPYSHKDPKGLKWRDTDVLYSGPAVNDSLKLFAQFWNDAISSQKAKATPLVIPEKINPAEGKAKISHSFSNPPSAEGTSILTGMIKAMYGASKNINIENAYFVPIPALTQALLDARARGVEVNIFTNSKDSIDPEAKSVSDISMKGLYPLYKAGARIYLKKGETLHSKFMTVDGIYCSIGSYNLHPRGERYDSEVNLNIIDPESVPLLDEVFKKGVLNQSVEVKTGSELVPDQSWFSKIVEKYFFAHLGRK